MRKDNIIGKFEDEQKHNPNFNFYDNTSKQLSLQNKDMNLTMDTSITQEDYHQFQKVTSCDNFIENICKNVNKLTDLNIPIPQLLANIKNSSNLKSDENESGIERKQS
ncbi:uncharacterized protein LOC111029579 [Myzus persicae]|uniref:uncharacterized protein LOC111029579 n=1 Tax=Myzus persicae TaxID=13164 RepID=UPI000B9380EC|nr:uncharacterized protein LOC111029579 [Myzus persicae]